MEINNSFLPYLKEKKRYLIFKGGSGSGKSLFTAQKILLRITTEKNHRILVIRKVARTIRSSTYQLFIDLINLYKVNYRFEINKTEFRIKDTLNGNEILMVGLDDQEKLKSIQGITSIWIEEATELEDEDFMQVDLRLRGETSNYKQIILTFNPIDEQHWIKKRFFDKKDRDTTIFNSTYKDNAFIDKEYKQMLEEAMKANENWYRIYVKGEWGQLVQGGEFYKCFKFSKHIKQLSYNKELALHISFDFNVNPYMTCLIYQIEGKQIKQIDEFCLEHPRNSTKAICLEFIKKYQNHTSGLFVYGDPSGRRKDTRSESGFNDYKIIESILRAYRPALRVSNKAPSVVMRGNFINLIFESNFDEIEILIDNNCKNTINDLVYLKEDSDGKKKKEMVKNKNTGVSYEKYGHCLAKETKITTINGDVNIENIKKGDYVLTRKGYRKVLFSGITGKNKEVVKLNFGFTQLICTPEHKLFINNKFKKAKDLIHSDIFCILHKKKLWKKKRLFLMDINSTGIHFQKICQTENIIRVGVLLMVKELKNIYIDIFGNFIMGKFLKNFIFTIKTMIFQIINYLIWNLYPQVSIYHTIGNGNQTNLNKQGLMICITQDIRQQSGMGQKRAENGIKNMLLIACKKKQLSVKNVVKNILQNVLIQILNFVQHDARIGIMHVNIDVKKEFLSKKEKYVYDLTIEGEHEFFANGILVHNCGDGMDYMICEAFKNSFKKYSGKKVLMPR